MVSGGSVPVRFCLGTVTELISCKSKINEPAHKKASDKKQHPIGPDIVGYFFHSLIGGVR